MDKSGGMMKGLAFMRCAAAILGWTLCAGGALAQTPSVTLIDPAADYTESFATGISGDGHSIAGYSLPGTSPFFPSSFRWTTGGGREDFGLSLGTGSYNQPAPLGISADGQYVVGNLGRTVAYRWSSATGFQDLGMIPGWDATQPYQVNGDGSVFVGTVKTPVAEPSTHAAFRWTQGGGYQVLPYLRTTTHYADATGVSRDGNVVVGAAQPSTLSGPTEAWRWTPQGGTQELIPRNNPMFINTGANAVSGDGRVIVGFGDVFGVGIHAFRWTQESGMIDLGVPPGAFETSALLTNFDGSVIVGSMTLVDSQVPAIWRQGQGFMQFSDYLASYGVAFPGGYGAGTVTGISDDGLTFCGTAYGINGGLPGRAFVVTVPSPQVVTTVPLFGIITLCRRRR